LKFITIKSRLSINAKNGEPNMDKSKVALAICFSLIVVLAGFSAWSYVGAKGLESEVSDLESKVSNLETQNAELETQNAELESKVSDSESRVSEQLVIVGYPDDSQSILFTIMHMGTAEVTISEIRVDNVLNSSSPGWVGNGTLMPGQMGEINLYGLKYFADGFTEGNSYQFRFATTKGNSFYCVVLYEGLTFPFVTEKLEIIELTWNYNATFTVINTGTADLTIVEVQVNDEYTTMNPSSVTLNPGGEATITVSKTEGFTSGVKYEFSFITASGNRFSYVAVAP